MWQNVPVFNFKPISTEKMEKSGETNEKVAYRVDGILSFLEQFLKLNNLKMNIGKIVIMRVTTRKMFQKS